MSTAEATARVFAALGDRTRMTLLVRLSRDGGQSIARLSTYGTLTRQAITKHLRVLEDAGLVTHERSGRETRYAARQEPLAAARTWIDDVGAQWEDALDRLKAFVEN